VTGLEVATSLDTPVSEGTVLSGYNFREVAPEVLSPLSWSLIGAGMEVGFRRIAAHLGSLVGGSRPEFVAYLSFRPFHQVSPTERLIATVPGLDRNDCWEFLLGGPPPLGSPLPPATPRWRRANVALREAALLGRAQGWAAECAAEVQQAERWTSDAVAHNGPWAMGEALHAAVHATRRAWALHAATTSAVVVGVGLLRRALWVEFDRGTTAEILRTVVRRSQVSRPVARLAEAGPDAHRFHRYEVADGTEVFARWSADRDLLPDAAPPSPSTPLGDATDLLPRSTAGTRVLRGLAGVVHTLVGEREASKTLGLRALHCVRRLLDQGAFGVEPELAAMLAVEELRRLSPTEQRALAGRRGDELAAVAGQELAVDLLARHDGFRPLRRPLSPLGDVMFGTPLAPGWAQGDLSFGGRGLDAVLAGTRVESHELLRSAPRAVVTQFGSMLSHVAIVCRELGVPLVSGIDIAQLPEGTPLVVDGWSGRVSRVAG
jgi:pyruvate,water dikinase